MPKKVHKDFLKLKNPDDSPDLGRLVAEQDQRLLEYYISPQRFVARANNVDDPAVFFIGPKGIGKSAILQMVRLLRESDEDRIINISPDDLAFSALANVEANSPILNDAGKNQWLFKSLWDYVLALEILRREYPSRGLMWDYFQSLFRGQHESEARALLKISVGESPQSLSSRILQLVKEVELAGEICGTTVSAKAVLDSVEQHRGAHLNLLTLVNSVAKDVARHVRHPYFILIDDLDLHWTDTPIQNAFIAALFFSLRHFSHPPHLKCVVAIRDEIYRRLPLVDRDKFHDWVCNVSWDALTIKEMIEQRVFRKLNCAATEIWGGVFPIRAFETMYVYTQGRPREAIRLAWLCIERARSQGHKHVDDDDLRAGIHRFSDERLLDLASEHKFVYPALDTVLRKMSGWPKEVPFSKLKELAELLALEVEMQEAGADRYTWVAPYGSDPKGFIRILLERGVLLVKASRTAEAKICIPGSLQDIDGNMWFAVHPTYGPALGLIGA